MSAEPCVYCGSKNALTRHVTRSFGKGDNLLVIEEIPLVSCGNCGESYFTAATMHEIERVKTHRKALAEPRYISVAHY